MPYNCKGIICLTVDYHLIMYKKIEESQTLLINNQSVKSIAQNKKIIQFGFGQSPFTPPQKVLNAYKNAIHHSEYTSVQGDDELRELMAQFHHQHNGLTVLPDNILIAPGSKSLIFSTLLALDQADVFIPTPAWVSYAPQVKLTGHHGIPLQTDFKNRWRITPKTIKKAVKYKKNTVSVLILNFPGNPDGLTYTEQELKELAQVVRELDVLVIADEIYGLLNYKKQHLSFANYYPEKTITTTGLSKWCGAGGWRFGAAFLYQSIDPAFKKALIGIGSETYSCAPTPVQMAAKVAYEDYHKISLYLNEQTAVLKEIGEYCTLKLNSTNIQVHSPQGGFYIFPDFSLYKEQLNQKGIYTSNDLCEQLLQDTGVALLPASAFGFKSDYLAARLAFVDFKDPLIKGNFKLENDCPNIFEGIRLITEWIQL